MQDTLGDRIKQYEEVETNRRFLPLLPVCARIDGRSFSKFTKGMNRPYDIAMSNAMIETTKFLVDKTSADIGYTQSDEITLIWKNDKEDSSIFFDGRVFKMTSNLAALATAKFMTLALTNWPKKLENTLPTFDARVFQVPNIDEAVNTVYWRVQDAVKNSISMASSAYYSHKELQGKNSKDKQEMLFAKGINWNDYPVFFKQGTFISRQKILRELTSEELEKIPEAHRPTGPVERTTVMELDVPNFKKIKNRKEFLFYGESPLID